MHKKYRYLFQFKKRKMEPLDLLGKSIEDFWNEIYDVFDFEGKMVVKRLDGKKFT